jgi:hypothetical protein
MRAAKPSGLQILDICLVTGVAARITEAPSNRNRPIRVYKFEVASYEIPTKSPGSASLHCRRNLKSALFEPASSDLHGQLAKEISSV